jgi:two-component system OmpR family sensor kinase
METIVFELLPGAAAGAGLVIVLLCVAAWIRSRNRAPGPLAPLVAAPGPGTRASALADAYEQVESRLAALTETVEKQRQIHSLMSHELRAPVATISAATQSLEMALAGSGEQIDSRLQRIGRAVARITELMDQLLSQESIYDQALVPDRRLVDLAGLANEIAASLQRDAAHNLVVRAPAETPAWCDGPMTGVVLRNLMHNAIKYSPADQPIEIEVGTRSGDIAWISVTDHGPGIERDDQSRIFDPHFRRSAHRETKGLGIGLYLVRKICERQDGTLTVESEPGKGARFTITLPIEMKASA